MSPKQLEPERTVWRGEGVSLDQVVTELARMHRAHEHEGHEHALTRTMNLVVAPSSPGTHAAVEAALARLGDHSPSRTLVLRRHRANRLDAEATLECGLPGAVGRVGVCHDRVTLTADDSRLAHAASLLAPLLLVDLPTVLWLPEPRSPIPDPHLLERAQQVLVDSASAGVSLGRWAALARDARVHDLTWGRLEFWRAATAAAFERPERRSLLPRITSVDLDHEGDAQAPALLLVGWIVARAGWRPERVDRDDGLIVGKAVRPDGGAVALSLGGSPQVRGCGGIETLTFRAGSEEVMLTRGAATSRLRDLFAEALQPLPSFARGYAAAVGTAAAML